MRRSRRGERSWKPKVRLACSAIGVVAIALWLSACGGSNGGDGTSSGSLENITTTSSGKPEPGGTLTITTPLEPITLDPNAGELDAGSQHAQRLIFQQLLEVEPGPKPEIVRKSGRRGR